MKLTIPTRIFHGDFGANERRRQKCELSGPKPPPELPLLRLLCGLFLAGLLAAGVCPVQAEGMLELFQMNWNQVSQKMPEMAEAGYDSLWLPNPAKGNSGGYSFGYDQFDPFDLGSTNQQGTVATR